MKYGTRQYAKRQIRWLKNKLLPAIYSANGGTDHATALLPVYLLDATGELTVFAFQIPGGVIYSIQNSATSGNLVFSIKVNVLWKVYTLYLLCACTDGF